MHRLTDKNVVLIGGGTGTSVFLRTLKHYTKNITAIVTVADDGGSSGTIRREFGLLPPGDIRNCLVSLAEDENIMAALMDVRFSDGLFKKQSLGNLMLAAMTDIAGSFPLAVKRMGEVLKISGNVYPVTEQTVSLEAFMSDGNTIKGETNITRYASRNRTAIDKMCLKPEGAELMQECREAIQAAQIIVYAPGSLYTSLIPNLLVGGMSEALESSKAEKYYIANIMTERGETDFFTISDHIHAIEKHSAGHKIIDYVVYNTEEIPQFFQKRYSAENADAVSCYISEEHKKKYGLIPAELVTNLGNYIRHDSDRFWQLLDSGEIKNINNSGEI